MEKEYKLYHRFLVDPDDVIPYLECLTVNREDQKLSLVQDGIHWKNTFTQDEIEALKEKYRTDFKDFDIVEVGSEDDDRD